MGMLEALSSHTQYKLRPPPPPPPAQALFLTTSPDSCQEEVGLEDTGAHRERLPFKDSSPLTPRLGGVCRLFLTTKEAACLYHLITSIKEGTGSVRKSGTQVGNICVPFTANLSPSSPSALISPLPFWLDGPNLPSAPSSPVPPLQGGHPAFLPSPPIIRTHRARVPLLR